MARVNAVAPAWNDLVATLPAITAGVLLTLGVAGGRYALSVEVATAITVAAYYAWILLIEVRR